MSGFKRQVKRSSVQFMIGYLLLIGYLLVKSLSPESLAADNLHIDQAGFTVAPNGTVHLKIKGSGLHDDLHGLYFQSPQNKNLRIGHYLAGEYIRKMTIDGDLLAMGIEGDRFVLARLDEDGDIRTLGSLQCPGPVSSIQFIGHQVLVGLSRGLGFLRVDITRPEALVLLDHVKTKNFFVDMEKYQDHVYAVDFDNGLYLLEPGAPRSILQKLSALEYPWRLVRQGEHLVVVTTKGNLALFRALPNGDLDQTASQEFHINILDMVFVDDFLVIATADNELQAWDLSDWSNPRKTGNLVLPSSPIVLSALPGRRDVVAGLVGSGVVRIQVDRAGKLHQTGNLWSPLGYANLLIRGDILYAAGKDGVEVFDLEKIDSWRTPHISLLDRGHAKILNWNDVIFGFHDNQLINYTGYARPADKTEIQEPYLVAPDDKSIVIYRWEQNGGKREGAIAMNGKVSDAVLDGTRLYAIIGTSLIVFDANDPHRPVRLGALQMSGHPKHISLLPEGFAAITARSGGLQIVDLHDPAAPKLAAQYLPPLHLRNHHLAQDLLMIGPYAYLCMGLGGVEVLDLSLPEEPRSLELIDTPGNASALTRIGNLLVVLDGNEGGFILDVRTPSAPQPIGPLPLPVRANQILAAGDDLIMSGLSGGVYRTPLPQILAELHTDGDKDAWFELSDLVDLADARIYLYDGEHAVSHEVDMVAVNPAK